MTHLRARDAALLAALVFLLAGCGGNQNTVAPAAHPERQITHLFWVMLAVSCVGLGHKPRPAPAQGVAVRVPVFGVLALWPWAERKLSCDRAHHNLLERPRDNPWRTSLGAAFLAWIFLVFMSGSADRVDVFLGLDYATQIWIYRVAVWAVPPVVFLVTRRVCRELVAGERALR